MLGTDAHGDPIPPGHGEPGNVGAVLAYTTGPKPRALPATMPEGVCRTCLYMHPQDEPCPDGRGDRRTR